MYTDRYANFDLTTGLNDGTSEANAWRTIAAMQAGAAAGNRVNIKRQAVPYQLSSSIAITNAGTALAPIHFRCYENTPGDGGLWELSGVGGGLSVLSFEGANVFVEGVDSRVSPTGNLCALNVFSGEGGAYRCRSEFRGEEYGYLSNAYFCDIVLNARAGGDSTVRVAGGNGANVTWYGCRIRRPFGSSFPTMIHQDSYGRAFYMIGCLVTGLGQETGLNIDRQNDSRGLYIVGNRFHNLAYGITFDEEPDALREDVYISGNIFDKISGYGIHRTNASLGYVHTFGNLYHDCTSGFSEYPEETSWGMDTELPLSPFKDPENGDFTLNELPGGGAIARARGFPVHDAFDWDTMQFKSVYQGPTPEEIAREVWQLVERKLS